MKPGDHSQVATLGSFLYIDLLHVDNVYEKYTPVAVQAVKAFPPSKQFAQIV
jgi:hypothetical protein